MRKAELVMATVMGVFSAYLMWKSAELPIGWIPREGPGGGAFPFWLATGMLLCCIWIGIRGVMRISPVARSTETYMDAITLRLFLLVAGSLTVMMVLIQLVGVYVATPLFMLFYIRVIGRHSWALAGSIAVATPIVTFFFFEIALTIILPKGITEPLFYPLYDIFM